MPIQVAQFLTADAKKAYDRDGFLVLPGLLRGDVLERCRQATQRLLDDRDDVSRKRSGSSYGRVFLQAFRIGRLDEAFGAVTYSTELGRLATHLGGFDAARVFIEQLIVKFPGDAPTLPHQDAPFLSYDDTRSLNFWIALEDVNETNGTLRYYPGSHLRGNLGVVHLDQPTSGNQTVREAVAQITAVTVSLRAGDAAVHNACTIHAAGQNRGELGRPAIAVQFMPNGAVYNGLRHDFFGVEEPSIGSVLCGELFPLTATAAGDR